MDVTTLTVERDELDRDAVGSGDPTVVSLGVGVSSWFCCRLGPTLDNISSSSVYSDKDEPEFSRVPADDVSVETNDPILVGDWDAAL